MHPPSRARRILKWTGVGLSLLILAGWMIGRWWAAFLVVPTNRHFIFSGAGFVGVVKTYYDTDARVSNGFHYHGAAEWGLALPEIGTPFGHDELSIVIFPYWLLLLLAAIPTAWLWHRDQRRIRPGRCPRCGYDLTGNTSGVCSECGERMPTAKRE